MSVINSDSVRAGASGAVTAAYTIEQSCRFNDDDSAFLSRTPGVAGNRRTWTFSVWFKRGNITSVQNLFNAGASEDIAINAADQLIMNMGTCNYISTQLFRDPGAWFHLIVAVDTTQSVAASRVRFYGNGTEITAFGTETNPAQHEALAVNSSTLHSIGSNEGGTEEWDGYLADVHLIDGQQLAPTSFGETDDQGNWVPIEFEEGSLGSAATITYTDEDSSGTDLTTYTFSSMALGSAGDNRICLVGITAHAGTRTVSTLTVDGNACTYITSKTTDTNTAELWMVPLTDGETSGDVVVQWSGGANRCGCIVWNCLGVSSTNFDAVTDAPAISVGIDVPAGGVVAAFFSNNGNTPVTWTAPTERVEVLNIENAYSMGGASDAYTEKQTVTVACTDFTGASGTMCAVSFGPVDETYGINGFRLDFASSSHFGKDIKIAAPYAPNATLLNGGYMTRGAALTGAANGGDMFISCWVQFHTLGARAHFFEMDVGVGPLIMEKTAANQILFTWVDTGTTVRHSMITTNAPMVDERWHHIMIAVDHSVPTQLMYIDDVPATKTDTTNDNTGSMGWVQTDLTLGARVGGSSKQDADWADFVMDDIFLDISVIANRRKFIDASGNPVDIGTDGTTALAASPLICITNAFGTFHTNNGTGGGFTETGTLAVASNQGLIGNSFEDSGLATNDQTNDVPSDSADEDLGNYPTWNPLIPNSGSVTNGNLEQNTLDRDFAATQALPTGNWYWELDVAAGPSGSQYGVCALIDQFSTSSMTTRLAAMDFVGLYGYNGNKRDYANGATTDSSYGSAVANSSIVQVAAIINGAVLTAIWFGDDGTWIASATDAEIAAGTTTNAAFTAITSASGYWWPAMDSGGDYDSIINFGQLGFAHTPPDGFKSLCTANFPAPAIKDPSKFFQTDIYTGTGSELVRTLTDAAGSAVKPDLVWIKDRDTAVEFVITDSARGATKELNCDSDAVETTVAEGVKSFDTSGYTLGTDGNYNTSSSLQVAWCWNTQGGAGSANEVGGINTTTTSLGATQGFSISTYTGTGSAATIGHGLGAVPEFMVVKERTNDVGSWFVYHHKNTAAPETDYLLLDSSSATADDATVWNDTAPTSTVFSVGTHDDVNESSGTYVAYIWTGIEGYSMFGSYQGNSSIDGPFCWCGFRPAWLWINRASQAGAEEIITDSARSPFNPMTAAVATDVTYTEAYMGTGSPFDFLSNGFKIRGSTAAQNYDTRTFVWAAFAEFPVGGSGVAQARAR
jgi:hypothetical protein